MHTFNEARKRFEPVETKCAYCGIQHSTKMDDNYFVPLFREQDRTNLLVYRSVKFNKIPIGIPRCESCAGIHESTKAMAIFLAIILAAAVLVFSIFMWGIFAFFAIFPCIFIVFGYVLIENILVRQKGILTKMDGAKENETVQEFVIAGWSFTQPSA